MKQLYCPHRVTISGIQLYCNNGKFPVDCEHCDCPDKQMLDVTVTIGSVILPKNKTNSPYVMCYGLDGTQDTCKDCTNRRGCINCENGELKETSLTNLKKPKDMKELNEIIICACGLPEHQMVFRTIEGDEDVCVAYHLCKLSFWKRLKYGVKYIFGYTSRYGAFDEMIFTKEHIPTLEKVIKWLKADHNPIR